jgi:uncharacterized membrane protein YeaQ/YmgE (transglycosylase-associated protein family)
MVWHWVFTIVSGFVAGWSLAGYRLAGEQHERGHLARMALGALAMVGFTYSGLAWGLPMAGLTFVVALLAAVAAYLFASRRAFPPRPPARSAEDEAKR